MKNTKNNKAVIVDSHCHLDFGALKKDLSGVLSRAKSEGVHKMLTIGTNYREIGETISLSERFEEIFFATGVHPNQPSDDLKFNSDDLLSICAHEKMIGVGETGLDFFRNLSTYEEQIFAFEEQIKIAIDTNKPLFLHQRDSHEDFIKILRKYSPDINKAVVHCFTGTQKQLDDYLELDCYIGVTGWICDEKRNVELRKTIKNIPLSKLMIETDCPYLIPKNLLDKPKNNRNEPSYLNHIVTEISILLDTDEEDVRNESFKNTLSFFQSVN